MSVCVRLQHAMRFAFGITIRPTKTPLFQRPISPSDRTILPPKLVCRLFNRSEKLHFVKQSPQGNALGCVVREAFPGKALVACTARDRTITSTYSSLAVRGKIVHFNYNTLSELFLLSGLWQNSPRVFWGSEAVSLASAVLLELHCTSTCNKLTRPARADHVAHTRVRTVVISCGIN